MSESVPKGSVLPLGLDEDPLFQYTRVFTKFLQLVFGSFERGDLKWLDDMTVTEIVIQAEGTVSNEVVEKRPAIVVSVGPAAFTNVSMDQFAGPLLDPKTGKFTPNANMETGARRYTDLISASMTYNCLSSAGVEAKRIAWTCAYATRVLKHALMKLNIHRVGEELQVGSESAPGAIVQPASTEIILVAVSVPFFFQQTWTRTPADKTLLNQVTLALRSELGYPAPEPVVLKGPGMHGVPLQVEKRTSLNQVVIATSTGGTATKK